MLPFHREQGLAVWDRQEPCPCHLNATDVPCWRSEAIHQLDGPLSYWYCCRYPSSPKGTILLLYKPEFPERLGRPLGRKGHIE